MSSRIIPVNFREGIEVKTTPAVVEDETDLLTPAELLDRAIKYYFVFLTTVRNSLPSNNAAYHFAQVEDLKEFMNLVKKVGTSDHKIFLELIWVKDMLLNLRNSLPVEYFQEVGPQVFDQLQEFIDCVTMISYGRVTDRRGWKIEA